MLDYRIALGNAIKAARTELNLTQNEVADLINSDSRTPRPQKLQTTDVRCALVSLG